MLTTKLVRNTFLFGLSQVLPRLPLFLSAYLLTKNDYNVFNKYYYIASIIILWSCFGFDIGANNSKTTSRILLPALLVNTIICSAFLLLSGNLNTSLVTLLSIITYSFSAAATFVFLFRILFQERSTEYLAIIFVATILFIITLLMTNSIGIWFFLSFFPAYNLLLLIFVIKKSDSYKKCSYSNNSIQKLYGSGFLSFSVNGLVPLVFATDKFLINQNFEINIANSYTFAWTITSPVFYIGNIVEKLIYSSDEKDWQRTGLLGLLMSFLMISIYFFIAMILINFYPSVFPSSVDWRLIKSMTFWMLPGFSIYAVFHFPLNGILFKYRKIITQKRVVIWYLLFAVITLIAFLMFREIILSSYFYLLGFTMIIIYSFLIIKGFTILILKEQQA